VKIGVAAGLALTLTCHGAWAISNRMWIDSGKAVAYSMPAVAAGVAVYKRDWQGLAELAVVTGLTYGTAYGLKHLVRDCRPFAKPCTHDGGDWDSFPSTTSAISSAPSAFMWRRYGWEWGLPMFVISKYPGFAMDKAKQNKLLDGLAVTAISWGYNAIFTTRYHANRGFHTDLEGDAGGAYVRVAYQF